MHILKKKISLIILTLLLNISTAQIPPGYYDGTQGLYGESLKEVLHEIIDDHDEPSYSDLRDFILPQSDEDPQNPENIILLYTGRSQAKSTFGGGVDDWNREHVWAKSHGGFDNDPPCGTDAHMIRPTDVSVNGDRGNKDFDEGGQQHSEATGCYYTDVSWEPRDEVKGDVARMILYMDVRYEGDNGELDLTAVDAVNTSPAPEHGKLSTLLQWHEDDPPDAFEINRNEVVYSYQGNRNPFIDHPEFVYDIWGESAGTVRPESKSNFKIYPNPVYGEMSIRHENPMQGISKYVIYNNEGRLLLSGQIELADDPSIDCSNISEGFYFITLTNEPSGGVFVSSFIKIQ